MKAQVSLDLAERAARRYEYAIMDRGVRKEVDTPKRVIAVSRMFGAGGMSVTKHLADRLQWPVWDREILDVLASESQGRYQSRMFEVLDEKTQGLVESFLTSISHQIGKQTYVYLLHRAIYIIAQNDAVLLGRGAHLLLPDSLKVLLKASKESRVSNVMRLLNLSEREARKEIVIREQEREAFLDELTQKFGRHKERDIEFDLEINTDTLDFEEATDVIMAATKAHFHMQ